MSNEERRAPFLASRVSPQLTNLMPGFKSLTSPLPLTLSRTLEDLLTKALYCNCKLPEPVVRPKTYKTRERGTRNGHKHAGRQACDYVLGVAFALPRSQHLFRGSETPLMSLAQSLFVLCLQVVSSSGVTCSWFHFTQPKTFLLGAQKFQPRQGRK